MNLEGKGLFRIAANLLRPTIVAVKIENFQLFALTYPSVTVAATRLNKYKLRIENIFYKFVSNYHGA